MSCAWTTVLTAQTDNTAFPDAAEAIFGGPVVASAGTRIVLSGRFPDARYVSVQVYTPGGVGMPNTAYSAAKFAVRGFTEALIEDLRTNAPQVRAVVVLPGHVGTDILTARHPPTREPGADS